MEYNQVEVNVTVGKGSRKKARSGEEGQRLDREEAMKSSPMTARQLALTMKRSQDRHPDIPYVFLIGAGCSRSSGILLASELVRDVWMPEIQKELELKPDEYPDGYDKENPGAWYSKAVSYLFRTADRQQAEFAQLTKDAQPGFGYYVLSELMDTHKKQFSTVLTTNFDNLLVDALTFFQGAQPLVVYHSQLIRMATPERERPAIIKLHNDIFYSPRNTEEDLNALDGDLVSKVANLLRHRPLIIMGYSGNDPSVLKLLQACDTEMEIYWVSSRLPENEGFRRWLTGPSAKSRWVKHGDFDRFMLEIANVFEMKGGPDRNKVLKRLDDVEEHYQKVSSELRFEAKHPGTGDIETPQQPSEAAMAYLAYQEAIKSPDVGDKVFEDAFLAYPESKHLFHNYAQFLSDLDKVEAEVYFNRALHIDPLFSKALNGYAIYLARRQGRQQDARDLYLRTLEIAPKSALVHANYAALLMCESGDESETLFLKALDLSPDNPYILYHFTSLLDSQNRMKESEAYFERAIQAHPEHVELLTAFALSLSNQGRTVEAESMFNNAMKIESRVSKFTVKYVEFLYRQDRFQEADAKLLELDDHLQEYKAVHMLSARFIALSAKSKPGRMDLLPAIRSAVQDGWCHRTYGFEHVLNKARQENCPQIELISDLADVINDKQDVAVLDKYDVWKNA